MLIHIQGSYSKSLSKSFQEFLNRIDDIVIFNSLTKENINQIIDIEMKGY